MILLGTETIYDGVVVVSDSHKPPTVSGILIFFLQSVALFGQS